MGKRPGDYHFYYRTQKENKERKGQKTYSEKKENFPNMKKETDIYIQEAPRVPNKMNSRKPTARHIIIKVS